MTLLSKKLEEQLSRMQSICDENDLLFGLRKDNFPIIMTIKPHWEKAAQMKFDLGKEEPSIDPESMIELVFGHDLVLRSFGDFVIDDDLLNKIKNGAKKLHYLYLQLYFEQHKTISNSNFQKDAV